MSDNVTFSQEDLRARFNPDGSLLRRQQMVMLEMVKEHRLEAEQKKLFGDIKVTATDELFEQA